MGSRQQQTKADSSGKRLLSGSLVNFTFPDRSAEGFFVSARLQYSRDFPSAVVQEVPVLTEAAPSATSGLYSYTHTSC